MARLNEAPLRNEAVDPEKRKFVRNNNDLIRVNYTQQKKIRDLEIEQSRLRTENLCLREEVLRLRNQLSDLADGAQLSEIDELRQELQRKLAEIGAAVAVLDKFKKRRPERRHPDPATWKRETPILDLAGRARLMPTLLEDEQYQRRTFTSREVNAIRLSDQSNESPDLGPPPVAHFDDADPIKFDHPAPIDVLDITKSEAEDSQTDNSVHVESRRKRRETHLVRLEPEDRSANTRDSSTVVETTRTSSKRKLDVRETEERSSNSEPFDFTRRLSGAQDLQPRLVKPATSPVKAARDNTENSPVRQILGQKSVNLSPRKVSKPSDGLDKQIVKKDQPTRIEAAKTRTRRPRVSVLSSEVPQEAPMKVADTVAENFPPVTPALDLLSPTSEPSSLSQDPGSTGRNPGQMANLEGMTRPSRRARAVTSYAEPSLNTKMRRPTKDMVSAVYTKSNQPAAPSTGEFSASYHGDSGIESELRNLTCASTAYQRSPLSLKIDSAIPKPSSPVLAASRAGSSATIGALRRVERPKSVSDVRSIGKSSEGGEDLGRRLHELSLDDFRDVSPDRRRVASSELRKIRRHSSISTSSEATGLRSSSPPQTHGTFDTSPGVRPTECPNLPRAISQPIVRSERLASRRRSMLV